MAQRFDLTAQLQLQANSSNVNQVVSQIKKQLAPLGNVKINVQANAKAVAAANSQVSKLNKNLSTSTKTVKEFGSGFSESLRRFGVISIITGGLFKFTQSIKAAAKEAFAFEVELIKISQVTGKTLVELSSLSQEVRKLSTELGVSSSSILNTSRVLLQTGLSASKTKQALEILAKTTLAATFDDIIDTTEGAIAIINQFGNDAKKAGGDIVFLEKSLDSINAVSKKFAVESSDLISVVRRVGGVFSSAGGSVNELIALFTSVRQTTREGAETIATGLRTIFTRIQRTDTVEALKDLNIELRDSEGKFVGAFEAVKRLSIGLAGLDTKDVRFSEIVEELGGFRQIGKVIPLIKQFSVAQEALAVAQSSSGSIASDAVKAQQSLSNQYQQTKEKFTELIAKIADSSAFRSTATSVLKIADALIKLADSITPLIPLLTTLFAF
jgi:TP901 family phage tail tape measure protein